MSNQINDWNELPLGLNANHVSKILGLSKPLVYELFNKEKFPSIKISEKRWVVPKDQLITWLEAQTEKSTV